MAGKWLEILSKGKVQAAVHRVKAGNDTDKARMSAPFFLRPRNHIALALQREFGSESGDAFDAESGARKAVESLNSFLWHRYF